MSQAGSQKERGAPISVLGEIMEFKVTGAETGNSLCVVELTSFPQNGPPPHVRPHRFVHPEIFLRSGFPAKRLVLQC